MKFKHARQHKKHIHAEFLVERDRYNNLSVVAKFDGIEVRQENVSELRLKTVQKSLERELNLILGS